MERRDGVPVGAPQQPGGVEDRGLADDGPVAVRRDLELEPRASGDPHLGGQAQQAVRPRSPRRATSRPCRPGSRRSGSRRPRRMPAPPNGRSSKPRSAPERVAVVPAAAARRCAGSARRRRRAAPGRARRASRSGASRTAVARVRGDGPEESASDQRVAANSRSSLTSARAIASRTPRGRTPSRSRAAAGVAHHRLVAQALHQLAADPRVDRGHQAEPEARQARGERGDGDHRPAQAALARVLAHQLAVRHPVGPADLQRPGCRRSRPWPAADRQATTSSIAIGWVRVVDPARRDHHRAGGRRAPGSSRTRCCPSRSRSPPAARSSGRRSRRGRGPPPGGSPGAATGPGPRRARRGRRSAAPPRPGRRRRRPRRPPGRRGGSRRRPTWSG